MSTSRQSRPTIGDVARLAGVSKATVSRVLNGSARVLPATRESVQAAIDSVGYRESWQAKALATGRTGAVGVIVTEPFDELYSDPTFAAFLRGIYDRLAVTRFVPVLVQASSDRERNKALDLLEQGAAEAVIHLTPYMDDGLLPRLAEDRVPTVIVGQVPDDTLGSGAVRFSCVYSDDVSGARLAAEYTQQQGWKRPLVIMGPRENPASVDRVEGYRAVYAEALDGAVFFGGWGPEFGREVIEEQLRAGREFDVVLAGSDRIAQGVLDALALHRVEVPGDVAVVGFDNHASARTTKPPLTTVEQPLRSEGHEAVELMLSLLAGEPPRTSVLPMRLVIRASA